MRTIAIRRCSQELQRILKTARKRDVILRSAEGDEGILALIDDFDYELAAQRRNKKLMAFLKERFRRARKEERVPLEEVRRRLGLPPLLADRVARREEVVKTITISRRAQAIARLLAEARSDDLLLKTDAGEYALTAIRDGDYKEANNRVSEVVMTYLDALPESCLPPLEVVFVQRLPRSRPAHAEQRMNKRNASHAHGGKAAGGKTRSRSL